MIIAKLSEHSGTLMRGLLMKTHSSLVANVLQGGRRGKEWAVRWIFRNLVFPLIGFDRFERLYSSRAGKKRVEPEVLFKISLLKVMGGYESDQKTLDAIAESGGLRAFVGIGEGDNVPCRKTLSRFRQKLKRHYNTEKEDIFAKQIILLLNRIHLALLDCFPETMYRVDSTMVDAFARRISRTELFYLTNKGVVKQMKRNGERIPDGLTRYLDKRDKNRTFHRKMDKKRLNLLAGEMLSDSLRLRALAGGATRGSDSFLLLERLLDEQTERGGDGSVRLRGPKETPSGSLQTPTEPDATYRNKNGGHVGFAANFLEAVYLDKKGKIIGSLIIHFQVEKNNWSDPLFLRLLLGEMAGRGPGGAVLVCDGAYHSAELEELCAQKGVELAPTALTGQKTNPFMAGFELGEGGTRFVSCPGGAEPKSWSCSAKTGQVRVSFPIEVCQGCPHFGDCRPETKKRVATVKLSKKAVARARVLAKRPKEEAAKISNVRNGVESVPSQLKNTYKIERTRLRGIALVKSRAALCFLVLSVVKIYRSMTNRETRGYWSILFAGQK